MTKGSPGSSIGWALVCRRSRRCLPNIPRAAGSATARVPLSRTFASATFDRRGVLWFTGQNGVYGRLDPKSGTVAVFDAPRGAGPYGIATTPDGQVFFASLAGGYLGQIDLETGTATVLEPPVTRQGARRVWSDSRGGLWVTGWNRGGLFPSPGQSK